MTRLKVALNTLLEIKLNRFIDVHADDYALSKNSDSNILSLCKQGILDSISVIPNLSRFNEAVNDFFNMQEKTAKKILVSVHLNFMEGKCCSPKQELPDLVDENGFFKVSWGKLFFWNYHPFSRNRIKRQLRVEILAQIRKCIDSGISSKNSIRIDSHQHPHMIPLFFEAIEEAIVILENEDNRIEYIRNTEDPVLLYSGKNIFSLNTIKCMILNFYSKKTRKYIKSKSLVPNYLCGVYYSGRMDERIKKVLPKFVKKAEKQNRTVELLFHPGTMQETELTDEFKKPSFNEFHLSKNRKIEFETALQNCNVEKQYIYR